MLLTGRELDRRGTRILPWLLAGMAASAVLPGLAGSVPALAASLLVVGVFTGATDVAMNAAVSELEVRQGTRLMQLAHALYSAGVLVGALATGLARELGADRLDMLGAVAIALLAAAALNRRHERFEPRPAASGRPRLSRAAIPLGIACAAAFVIEGGMENWGAIFLERDLEASPGVSALAPAAYGGAMMLGRLSGQWLESRLGDTVLFAGAMAVALAGLVGAAVAPNVPLAIAAFFVGGAGISIAAPALFGAGGQAGDAGGARERRRDRDDARLPRLPRRASDRGRPRRGDRPPGGVRRARAPRRRAGRRGAPPRPFGTCPRDCPWDTSGLDGTTRTRARRREPRPAACRGRRARPGRRRRRPRRRPRSRRRGPR